MGMGYNPAAIASAAANIEELTRMFRGEANTETVEQRLCAHVLLHHRLAPDERRHAQRLIA